MDALSEVLRLASLTGSVLADATAGGAWCVSVPAATSRSFAHVVLEGECAAARRGIASRCVLRAGDVAFLARGESHLLGSDLRGRGDALRHAAAAARRRRAGAGHAGRIRAANALGHARDLASTATWPSRSSRRCRRCSRSGFAAPRRSPGSPIRSAFRSPATDAPRPGGTAALSRVAELVLIEALRRHVEDLPPGGSGWLAGLNDRYVGAALALVHGRPGEHWTVERLARQVGLSRSALAERFSLVVGEPIFGFLTRVRLQLAAHELATTAHSIEAIAEGAGYEAVNSFSRAFKRVYGKPPSVWRRKSRRKR